MLSDDNKHFIRGGQVTLHSIRMYFQIVNKVFLFSVIAFFILLAFCVHSITSEYERYIFVKYFTAKFFALINPNGKIKLIQPNGIESGLTYFDILNSSLIKEILRNTALKIIEATIISLVISLILLIGVTKWLKKRGAVQTENKLLKGDSIVTKEITKKLIIKNELQSDLSLAGLPLIINKETAHILFHGTVGTGKSNAIKELLDQIRNRGDRVIIYDKSCNFLEEFFDPKNDILLNPLDDRGQGWDLWKECRDAADFDSLAAAQIPMPLSTQDPFWVNAARTIFSAAAFQMRNDPERTIVKLLRYLLTADLDLIQKYLKGTEAETLTSDKIEKTAVSIKSVLATYLKSLKYVRDDKDAFSIRSWIQNGDARNWLFITSLGDRHETLKPLISSWIDIAVNALLSLKPDSDRRIWLILDELTSLQQLPYLTQTLSESRKFGGCVVIGIQNYAQLAKLYGQDGAKEISSLLNTRYMFRQPDPEMAKWSAINFGESVIDEVQEGFSYGANTIRDGVSVRRAEVKKQVVSFSEIMSLNDLHAYVRLPGQFPVTLVDFKFRKRKRINFGLLERIFNEDRLKETNELIEKWENKKFIATSSNKKKINKFEKEKKTKQPDEVMEI